MGIAGAAEPAVHVDDPDTGGGSSPDNNGTGPSSGRRTRRRTSLASSSYADELGWAALSTSSRDVVVVASAEGRVLLFPASDLRVSGPQSAGSLVSWCVGRFCVAVLIMDVEGHESISASFLRQRAIDENSSSRVAKTRCSNPPVLIWGGEKEQGGGASPRPWELMTRFACTSTCQGFLGKLG